MEKIVLDNFELKFSKAILAIGGIMGAFFRSYVLVIVIVAIMMGFDIITGFLKSKINGNASSKVGYKGVCKKLMLLIALFFGVSLDVMIPLLLKAGMAIDLPLNLPFGVMVGLQIAINEAISVAENLHQSGVKLPRWVLSMLKVADTYLDGSEDRANDNF